MVKLFIVGIDPGSKDYLTQKAIDIVENVDITVGSWRVLNIFSKIKDLMKRILM